MIEQSIIQFMELPEMATSNQQTELNLQDVLEFKNAVKGEEGSQIKILETQSGSSSVEQTQTSPSIGDQIMERLDDMRESTRQQQAGIIKMMEKAAHSELDFNEMIKMQVAMYRLNYQLELTSKISSGAKDGVETLYKNQG